MNTQQRAHILSKFSDHLDSLSSPPSSSFSFPFSDAQFSEQNLPQLDVVQDLMKYHRDITDTIENTYNEVRDVMIHMKQLKNRKKNVQIVMDAMTACLQIKRLSYAIGTQPKQIYQNLEAYYQIKGKVYHVDKFIDRIQRQISELQREYQHIFDAQMGKNNSNKIGQISKVLQLIRKNAGQSSKPDTLQQIAQLCVNSAKKQFKQIQESLFAIPIVGNSESNYMFFDMSKTAMKIIATLAANCKNNVFKVSGEEGYIHVLKTLFELSTTGIIFQLLMRLRKYYQIDKIVINPAKRLVLKQKEYRQLQPYFKEYVAIWNQLQRLRIHLLDQISQGHNKKQQLKMAFENLMSTAQLVQINTSAVTFLQAMMRYRFDKLLKKSKLVASICNFDNDFFKEINQKNLIHNTHVQDFLQDTMTKISQGVQKAIQTLNTLVISAIVNFANHNLIYQDVFYAFNELFIRVFNKYPSSDQRVHHAMILALNCVAGFPRALKLLTQIKLPQEIPQARIKTELQEVVNNNEEKTYKVLQGLLRKIVGAQWFRHELQKDYQKILDKWKGLQPQCFDVFVQSICKVHTQIIQETVFAKKYTQATAINFERQIRSIISFYETYSHSILPHFKKILDYLQVLQLENENDFRDIIIRFRGVHQEAELKKIWALRS